MTDTQDLLNVTEAAAELGLTRSAIHAAIRTGQLQTADTPRKQRIGRGYLRLIERTQIEAYQRDHLGKAGWAGDVDESEQLTGLTAQEAAAQLGVTTHWVYQLIHNGKLNARHRRHEIRVSEESIARYQEERRGRGRPPREA